MLERIALARTLRRSKSNRFHVVKDRLRYGISSTRKHIQIWKNEMIVNIVQIKPFLRQFLKSNDKRLEIYRIK